MPHEHAFMAPQESEHPSKEILDVNQIASSFYANVERENVVGASLIVVNKKDILLSCTHGVQNNVTQETVSSHTLFPIASITKHVGAVLLCLMEEDGHLSLNDPLQKHLPDIQIGPKELFERIKCVDLLTHGIGLSSKDQPSKQILQERGMEAIFDYLKNAVPTVPYHTFYDYVNVPYALIPLLIEKFYGVDVETFAQQRVFSPLGMEHSTFMHAHSSDITTCYAKEYISNAQNTEKKWSGKWEESPLPHLPMYALAGGLLSSSHDMAKWLQWHLRGSWLCHEKTPSITVEIMKKLRLGEEKNTPPFSVIQKLYTPSMRIDPVPNYDVALRSTHDYGLRDYGLGLKLAMRSEFEPPLVLEKNLDFPIFCMHEGSLSQARSTVLICPKHNLAAIMMTNCGGQDTSSHVMFDIMDHVLAFDQLSVIPLRTFQ